jgi:hypothetical protein
MSTASAVGFEGSEKRQGDTNYKRTNACFKTVFGRPGGFGEKLKPDPIPNSAVNLLSADGTKSQDLGE